jgi:hypothetical protein
LLNILTVFYGPIQFLEQSLKHNYQILKKEKIEFKHYLIDNNFPLEETNEHKEKIKFICSDYNISYLNVNKNLGMIGSHVFFGEEIIKEGILFSLECDAFLKTEGILFEILKLHKKQLPNLIYLNTDYLKDYPKKIFKINDVNVFELDLIGDYNQDWSWVQSFSIDIKMSLKINKLLLKQKENYDVPGESSNLLKKNSYPMLVMNDFFDDMDIFRYSNYVEYLYYKSLVYFWSKIDINLSNLTFEFFIKHYDYYLSLFYFEEFSRDLLKNYKIKNIKFNFKFIKTRVNFYKKNNVKIFI